MGGLSFGEQMNAMGESEGRCQPSAAIPGRVRALQHPTVIRDGPEVLRKWRAPARAGVRLAGLP